MKNFRLASLFFFQLILVFDPTTGWGKDQNYINIGAAQIKSSPMALVPPLYLGTPLLAPRHLAYGKRFYDIIKKDLTISSYFSFISPEAFVENYKARSLRPKEVDPVRGFGFSSWKELGAEFMIRSGFKVIKNKLSLKPTSIMYPPEN